MIKKEPVELDLWSNIPKHFEKINIDSYKFVFDQCKDRFLSTLNESENITNKSWNLLKINTLAISASLGFVIKFDTSLLFTSLLICIYFIFLITIYKLIAPKSTISIGSKPSELYKDYLDDEENNIEEKEKSIYYYLLVEYEYRINKMNSNNHKRLRKYNASLIITVIISMCSVISSIISIPT